MANALGAIAGAATAACSMVSGAELYVIFLTVFAASTCLIPDLWHIAVGNAAVEHLFELNQLSRQQWVLLAQAYLDRALQESKRIDSRVRFLHIILV